MRNQLHTAFLIQGEKDDHRRDHKTDNGQKEHSSPSIPPEKTSPQALSPKDRMIVNLLRIAGAVIILYLVLKIIDLSVRGAWGEVFSGGMEGNMFLLETIVGFVFLVVIIFSP